MLKKLGWFGEEVLRLRLVKAVDSGDTTERYFDCVLMKAIKG